MRTAASRGERDAAAWPSDAAVAARRTAIRSSRRLGMVSLRGPWRYADPNAAGAPGAMPAVSGSRRDRSSTVRPVDPRTFLPPRPTDVAAVPRVGDPAPALPVDLGGRPAVVLFLRHVG